MKQSLINVRLRQLSWDVLDLSILENNSELGILDSSAIQQKRNQKAMSTSLGLQHQNVRQHIDPKCIPRVWVFLFYCGFLIVFFFVCLVIVSFNLPYKVIYMVQAGLKYSLFLCAPSLSHTEIMFQSHSAFTQCSSQVLLSRIFVFSSMFT